MHTASKITLLVTLNTMVYCIIGLFLLFYLPLGQSQTIKNYIDNQWQDSRYQVHGNGTVTDTQTGLMWKVCSEGQTWGESGDTSACSGSAETYTWKEALERVNAVNNETFAGHGDWRVPNIKEIASLAALDRYNPAINLTIFPNTPSSWFWSASPYAYYSDRAWQLYFSYGNDSNNYSRYNYHRVRLVRFSQ